MSTLEVLFVLLVVAFVECNIELKNHRNGAAPPAASPWKRWTFESVAQALHHDEFLKVEIVRICDGKEILLQLIRRGT